MLYFYTSDFCTFLEAYNSIAAMTVDIFGDEIIQKEALPQEETSKTKEEREGREFPLYGSQICIIIKNSCV